MVVNIEDAGFEIRDQIMWLYGSGFPKSHNVAKAIDATIKTGKSNPKSINESEMSKEDGEVVDVIQPNNGILGDKKLVTKNVGASLETKEAQEWSGFGTALKPANEPICVARKPLSEKSVAENVLKWGTGGINIDGCRVEHNDKISVGFMKTNREKGLNSTSYGGESDKRTEDWESTEGRFPANIILDEIAGELLDEQSGVSKSSPRVAPKESIKDPSSYNTGVGGNSNLNDSGGASRFFYQAKVSKAERNMGLDDFEDKVIEGRDAGQDERAVAYKKRPTPTKNTHPTVKPVSLMAYLCRLVTPPNGIVLDPFMGSGSTGIAARLEGFKFLGMEMDKDYFKIAEARIENYEEYRKFIK
jgi:site-specific DNA-methyltransferase (adenine-specific)